MRHAILFCAASLSVAFAGCTGVDMPVARDAWMQIPTARFVEGPLPSPASDVRVTAVESPNNTVRAGQRGKIVRGRTDDRAFALAMALDGDRGYWIVPVGLRSALFPREIEWDTALDFATSLPPGQHTLRIAAADADARYGEPVTLDLTAASLVPDADFVVSLAWDADADLNLVVEMPDGSRLGRRGLRDPDGRLIEVDPTRGPLLDADSNSRCVIDGRRVENAIASEPMAGRYRVFVEAWSLCGVARTGWTVTARLRGLSIAEARGASFAVETPTTGSLLAATEFDVAP